MKKALMIIAIVAIVAITGSMIYYFIFFRTEKERAELRLQEQKFELEKEKQRAEEVPIEEPKAEETVVKEEPFTSKDCRENLDISLGINVEEAKNFLGEPQSEEKGWNEFQGLNTLNVYYHDLELFFEEISGDYLLNGVSIYSSDYEGPRGIRIGDNTISVLEKFLLENREVLVVKPYYDEAYLYFIDEIDEFGFNKWGIVCFDHETGVIEGIRYSHAVPHSCQTAGDLNLDIEDDVVTKIHYSR